MRVESGVSDITLFLTLDSLLCEVVCWLVIGDWCGFAYDLSSWYFLSFACVDFSHTVNYGHFVALVVEHLPAGSCLILSLYAL